MPFPRIAPRLMIGLATGVVWALAAGSVVFWLLQSAAVPPAGALAGAAPAAATAIDVAAVARALGAQPGAGAAPAQADVAARLALRGVLTHGRGGAALIAVDGRPAKPLRVGARLEGLDGDWTLRAVTPHAAVLVAGAREVRLDLPPPGERTQADTAPRPVVAAPATPTLGMPGLRPLPTQ